MPTHEPDSNERALRKLEYLLLDADAFSLVIATFDLPRTRDEMIGLLKRRFEARGAFLSQLDLTHDQRETSFLRRLEEHLRDQKPLGVMVVGLESTLDYSQVGSETAGSSTAGLEMLTELNLQRERFPEICPYPIVFWLSPLATSALVHAAPDFWHWRSATFQFEHEKTTWVLEDAAMVGAPTFSDHTSLSEPHSSFFDALMRLGLYSPQDSPRQKSERLHLMTLAGIEQFRSGSYDDAGVLFDQALEIARSLEGNRSEAQLLALLGDTHQARRDLDRASLFYERALAVALERQQHDVELRALEGLAAISAERGDTQVFRVMSDEALGLARKVRDRRAESRILSELGVHEAKWGARDRAIEHFQESLRLVRQFGDRRAESQLLSNLGALYRVSGDVRQAVRTDLQALALARETGDERAESQVLGNLGAAYSRLGEPQRALEHLEASLAIAEKLGHRELQATSSWNLGLVHAQLGETELAAKLMQRLVDEKRAQGHPDALKHADLIESIRQGQLAREKG